MYAVTEGQLSTGVPYLRLGSGPPLLVASGLSSAHANPRGVWRRMALSWLRPLAQHFTVHYVNRKPGLASGATMADLAADYAAAIKEDIGQPVAVHGTSTGGSVVLQLAVDYPDLVQRMVVAAAACRLSEHGRWATAELARLAQDGNARGSSAFVTGLMVRPPFRYPAQGVGWLMGGSWKTDDPTDMVRTLTAEASFDAEPGLARVRAPTLVLGGTADPFYSEDLYRRTAAGMRDGRAVIFPGKSHPYVAGAAVPAGVALGFLIGG